MSGFAPPATWLADITAMISQIFGQYWPILLLICGLLLGFFVLEVLLNLARPRIQIKDDYSSAEDEDEFDE